jgi:hypothetical protein
LIAAGVATNGAVAEVAAGAEAVASNVVKMGVVVVGGGDNAVR